MMACTCTFTLTFLLIFLFLVPFIECTSKKDEKNDKKTDEIDKWKKKDVRDYNDADLERLFDQWEVRVLKWVISPADKCMMQKLMHDAVKGVRMML